MSPEIKIEKRKVNSLPSLFGELGGLNEIFASAIVIILSGYQANAFLHNSIRSLFMVNLSEKGGQDDSRQRVY